MTLDALLFLQRSDVPHVAAHRASIDGDGSLRKIFIDPGIMEDALLAGIDSSTFDFVRLDIPGHFQARATTEAMQLALSLDLELTRVRESLLGAGEFAGWDLPQLWLFFKRVQVMRHLGEACAAAFRGRTIGVLRPERPQIYYFDSFLSTEVFMAGRAMWRIAGTYEATRNWVETRATCWDFDRLRAAAGGAQALVHIPTCYADRLRFCADINARFPSLIDLPSIIWDIPVRRHDDRLLAPAAAMAAAHPELGALADRYRERARGVFDLHLRELPIGARARAEQGDLMADRCRIQALNFLGLRWALQGTRPHVVLADQDAWCNGPLFSVAAELGAEITVVPHSSNPTTWLPHGRRVTVVERSGCVTPVRTFWGARVAPRRVDLGACAPRARQRAEVVCLLLNTMTSEGLSCIDFHGMADFYAGLAALCQRTGAKLIVRVKPGSGAPHLVAALLGIDPAFVAAALQAPLEEIAARTDLCVSYGEPTTACMRFLESGGYVLNVNEQQLACDYVSTPALFGGGTLPILSALPALSRIEEWIAAPARFVAALAAQQAAFRRGTEGTQALLFPQAPTPGDATAPCGARKSDHVA